VKKAGKIVLFKFPQSDLIEGKLRPALVLNKIPGPYDAWLICMISSQLGQYIEGFDEILTEKANDFESSGLKTASVIRAGRLAVVEGNILEGSIGKISSERFHRLKANLAKWITDAG
jgi:mRNA interferase MazF